MRAVHVRPAMARQIPCARRAERFAVDVQRARAERGRYAPAVRHTDEVAAAAIQAARLRNEQAAVSDPLDAPEQRARTVGVGEDVGLECEDRAVARDHFRATLEHVRLRALHVKVAEAERQAAWCAATAAPQDYVLRRCRRLRYLDPRMSRRPCYARVTSAYTGRAFEGYSTYFEGHQPPPLQLTDVYIANNKLSKRSSQS